MLSCSQDAATLTCQGECTGRRVHTSVKIIAEGLRGAEEDALVWQFPQVLPVKALAAASQLLNGGLQSGLCLVYEAIKAQRV